MLRSIRKTVLLGMHSKNYLMPVKINSPQYLYGCQKAIVQTNMEQKRYYKNFGHRSKPLDRHDYLSMVVGFAIVIVFAVMAKQTYISESELVKFPKVDAAVLLHENDKEEDTNVDNVEQDDQKKKKGKKEKTGFRDRKIIEYENRIRHYSTPDKVFRYFATLQITNNDIHEVFMTPDDFLRSMTPGIKQPDGLGLDQYKKYDPKGVNSALTTYFFGPNMKQKLTIEKFLDFQEQLQREILSLEFERRNPDENGNITEIDFTELLLAYAGYSDKKKAKMLKRVKKTFKENPKGINKEEYLKFFHFLNNINDVDTALTFYNIAGASIDQATLKHVAKTVAHVDLSDHVIQVVYTIFDENLDGQLSNREFIAVMKNRVLRGLEKPKDTGFIKLVQSLIKCAKNSYLIPAFDK
ncbi:calcium uptake protein 1 homolog, mitochondrial isoform X3 [Polistes fuscatus]|uniref:calcium uptake protein 1 homolog, mitochondrial isoform X3 n=1 Tax=Polistes fuscatus TaxID=30207 RepID=UPI001CA7EA6F|nr:calcium uptake protein 1 homolog, mitochondrial isoform X3 [Polistes fuscatus]